jgi:Arc/MetJ-type ribon-helix-helix transcriptional regulator
MTTPRREAMTKVSVSMPEQTAQAAREMAGPGRFSAYVADAVQRRLELDRLADLVAGIEARRGGPIPDEVMAEVDAAWHDE